MFENLETHPSYGMLGFYRSSGARTPLFGSSIQHDNTIRMCLKHGKTKHDLNMDYYFGHGIIAEVEMSYSQFAEAITAMNVGDGVPVTIISTEKDGRIPVSSRPFIGKQEQFEQEFHGHLDGIITDIRNIKKEVTKLFNTKKSIGKADREDILNKFDRILMQIGSNTEFIYEQFNEQMNKTVIEAKGEIEAFIQNKMNSIALAAISENAEEFKKIENPIDEKSE